MLLSETLLGIGNDIHILQKLENFVSNNFLWTFLSDDVSS